MLSLEGKQLGNYTVTRRIRSGGMGAVYEGRQRTAFDRRVAIKVILGTYAADPDMRRRFAREAKTVARLHHPHILPLIEFGDEQGVLYLVMPFIEGGTLTGYLRRYLPDVHQVAAIFLQLLDAVEYAHDEGLIHRDIKSSNVLLESRRNGPPHAYLADFGLVRTIQQVDMEAGAQIPLDQVPGTPQYMAPEQTRGIVTPSTDIYALGVLLYQMLTGELPFNDPDDIEVIKMQLYAPVPNPRATDASIPAEMGALVARAMAKRPEQRFAHVGEFREALLAALERPVDHGKDILFAEEEDDTLFSEPAHLSPPLPDPPLPPRSPRFSQHLRMPPEPIEFAGPRRPRKISEPIDAPEIRRVPVKDEQNDDTPQRPRITGEQGEDVQRARVTDEPSEQPGPGVPPLARRTHVLENQPEAIDQGRRARALSEFSEVRRQRSTEDQGDAPVRGKRAASGDKGDAVRPQLSMGRLERADLPVQARPRVQSERLAPVAARPPLPVRSPLPGRQISGHRRVGLAIVGGALISVLLILLLLLPRVFGMSIFPADFPLLGSSSVAHISLSVKKANLHDTFLLTASPQTTAPNAGTRVMPDRSVTSSASEKRTVATSGLQSSGGTRANGTLHFDNSGFRQVTVSGGFTFITSNNVQVRLNADVVVPGRVAGQDGTFDASAEAVLPGQTGNIQANALDSPCCGGQVIVSNPVAFSGGSNGGVTHLVAQDDLTGVKNELTPDLRQQVTQQLGNLLQAGEVQAGTPMYDVKVTSDQPVGASADQVTVTVTITATELVYNVHTVNDLARQLLNNEASQSSSLGSGYQLSGGLTVSTPTIEQQGSNGQLYLSVSASGLWSYTITAQDEARWRMAVKGASLTLAQSYFSTQPGIANVHIDLPFGTDHLPTDETQIVFSTT